MRTARFSGCENKNAFQQDGHCPLQCLQKQECIPVGCALPASVFAKTRMHSSRMHTAGFSGPLSWTMHAPLHACHKWPTTTHAPLSCMPGLHHAWHPFSHAPPLPHMSPPFPMQPLYHACYPLPYHALLHHAHPPWPCMPPCTATPVDRQTPVKTLPSTKSQRADMSKEIKLKREFN